MITRIAQWTTDQDIQDNSAQTGHVDVTDAIHNVESNGDQGHMPKKGMAGLAGDITITVVAWEEKDEYGLWDVYLRVVYGMSENNDYVMEMSDRICVTKEEYTNDNRYPAVTAQVDVEYVLGPPWPPEPQPSYLMVDVVYEKASMTGEHNIATRRYVFDGYNDYNFNTYSEGSELIIPFPIDEPELVSLICRHPDIDFYSYQGDDENTACEWITVVYDAEFEWEEDLGGGHYLEHNEYGIVETVFYNDWTFENEFFLARSPKESEEYEYNRYWPQYPRVDAGIDFAYPQGDYGTSMATTVWQTLIWVGGQDPYYFPSYLDIDWFHKILDLSGDPSLWPEYLTPTTRNDQYIWSMMPYVDYDPIEKYEVDELPTYAHVVVTEGQDWLNQYFLISYTNSNLMQEEEMLEAFQEYESISGMATIAMYAFQAFDEIPGYEEPDFNIFFVSDHDSGLPIYPLEYYFEDEDCSEIVKYDDPIQISDSGNGSAWMRPYDFGPVGVVFDYRCVEAAWLYRYHDPDDNYVYGDYELDE